MPRLTYAPSWSSCAARAAICSRVRAIAVPLWVGRRRGGVRARACTIASRCSTGSRVGRHSGRLRHERGSRLDRRGLDGAALDVLVVGLLGGQRDDPLDVDAGQVDRVGIELTRLDQVLDLGDRYPAGHSGQRVKIARRLPEHQVAVPVTLPRSDHARVPDDRLLEHEGAPLAAPLDLAGLPLRRHFRDRSLRRVPPTESALAHPPPTPPYPPKARDSRPPAPP